MANVLLKQVFCFNGSSLDTSWNVSLYYAILYCTIYCTVPCPISPYFTLPYYTIAHHIALYFTAVLTYTAWCCIVLYCVVLNCIMWYDTGTWNVNITSWYRLYRNNEGMKLPISHHVKAVWTSAMEPREVRVAQLVRHWTLVPLVDSGGGEGLHGFKPHRWPNHEQTPISYNAALLFQRLCTVKSPTSEDAFPAPGYTQHRDIII